MMAMELVPVLLVPGMGLLKMIFLMLARGLPMMILKILLVLVIAMNLGLALFRRADSVAGGQHADLLRVDV